MSEQLIGYGFEWQFNFGTGNEIEWNIYSDAFKQLLSVFNDKYYIAEFNPMGENKIKKQNGILTMQTSQTKGELKWTGYEQLIGTSPSLDEINNMIDEIQKVIDNNPPDKDNVRFVLSKYMIYRITEVKDFSEQIPNIDESKEEPKINIVKKTFVRDEIRFDKKKGFDEFEFGNNCLEEMED